MKYCVRDEVEDGASSEDDSSLSEESTTVRFPVLMVPRWLGKKYEEIQQEQAGYQGQVYEERVGLKIDFIDGFS